MTQDIRSTPTAATTIAPWVTIWSDEIIPVTDIYIVPGLDRLRYLDENPSDWFMGVLWHRERIGMTGHPIFSQVHSRRQRRAMTNPQCQVCGTRLPKRNIPWLFSTYEVGDIRDDGRILHRDIPHVSTVPARGSSSLPALATTRHGAHGGRIDNTGRHPR